MNKTVFLKKFRLQIILVMVLFLCSAGISGAKSDQKVRNLKKEAKGLERKIKKGKADVKTFARKENTIIASLNETDIAISKARKRITASRAGLAALEKEIGNTESASESLMKQIQISEDYASRRMVALYKLSRLGKMNMLASADSITDFFQRKIYLERILDYDQKVLENLGNNKIRFQTLLEDLNAQKKKKFSLESDYKKQIRVMSRKKARRSELLANIRSKKSLKLASVNALKKAAKALDKKIHALILKSRETEKPGKPLSGKFPKLKGLLKMPVKGKVISRFGKYKNAEFDVMNFRSGIGIKAGKGDPIRAVYAGKVLFSSWFNGYGNMLIIDHGNHYCTLYAHAEEVFKKEGDRVEAGEVIATVGDTGSMTGPGLHFEVRHNGKSVDPMKWLKKS